MSVPVYKRSECDLTIINKVTDLVKEVIRLSKNEKLLPKKTEKLLRQTFLEDAFIVYKSICAANDLHLSKDNLEECKLRYKQQLSAKIYLSNLLAQAKLNITYLDSNYAKYEILFSLISDVKNLLNKWILSDKKRIS